MRNKIDIIKILQISSILLGFIYIVFIFWLRLIRERPPRELDGNYSIYTYYLYIFLFALSLFMVIFYLRKIFNIQAKYKIIRRVLEIHVISNIINFLIEYIFNAPYNLYIYIYNKYDVLFIIEKIGRFFWDKDLYKQTIYLYISLCFCKVIVISCFIVDVFVFDKFAYFYKSLLLLLVTLVINSILFILKDISEYNRDIISTEYISIENNENNTAFYLDFQPNFKGEKTEKNLQGQFNAWLCYTTNCMFVDNFEGYKNTYEKYIKLIYYIIFVIGWFYILYHSS